MLCYTMDIVGCSHGDRLVTFYTECILIPSGGVTNVEAISYRSRGQILGRGMCYTSVFYDLSIVLNICLR